MTRLLISARIAPYAETPVHAVRNGADVVQLDGVYSEAFGPDAFLAGGRGASIQDGHDSVAVGEVVVLAPRAAWWEMDGVIESHDPELLGRVKVGAPVSIGATILLRSSETDLVTRVRMHHSVHLEHVAICRPGERPGYHGAAIIAVAESKVAARTKLATAGGDWRSQLPDGWDEFRDAPWQLTPGMILLDGRGNRTSGWLWNGSTFERTGGAARLAA